MEEVLMRILNKLDAMDSRLDKLDQEVLKTNLIIEHDIQPRIKALFDGQALLAETVTYHTGRLERIEQKVDALSEVQNAHSARIKQLAE